MDAHRGHFSRIGFILASAGSAIGLGNLWKFSYITYDNQGGSFVLIYLVTILLVGAPIMMAEIVIGRSTQKSPVCAFLELNHPAWSLVGWLGIGTGFVILSYYNVVAGWTVHYFIQSLGWSINGFSPETAQAMSPQFITFLGNGSLQILYHALFTLFSVSVVVFGVKSGIERLTKILMPLLLLILIVLLVNSFFTPGFGRAIRFLFTPGPIRPESVLEAVGHAFFTLSLGMGAIITYGSYMSTKESIPRAAGIIVLMDTLIAVMASVIMFSIVFSSLGESAWPEEFASTGMLFTTIPQMFYQLPGGAILAPLFFLLVGFAALTSTISLLEVVVSYFIDHLNWPRLRATLVVGLLVFLFGILSALSLGSIKKLSGWTPFSNAAQVFTQIDLDDNQMLSLNEITQAEPDIQNKWLEPASINQLDADQDGIINQGEWPQDTVTGVFNTMDYLATNWFLPIGGILIAIFTGWVLKKSFIKKEVETGHGSFIGLGIWRFLLRFVCPLAVGWILYSVIFLGKTFN
ncbi:sodium-dependent transporter [candidate division KSB1 bacterium]|nr:sodium-dependent transporter [candidate division KSB1 bacterium]